MPTFHLYTAARTASEFATLAAQAAPLKAHGNVEMMVCSQAEPTRADMPPGGSPWHDYASYLPTWQKFFPHPKMQPFLDMDHVGKNRKLLADSLTILRQHGYSAAFSHHTPFFLPEPFFEKYPQLRGARCDHPRRTRREAFALCTDHPESRRMYTEMAADMIREIPELSWLRLVTNDAGAGLCWSDWLYPGPNGPRHCKHLSTAQRAHALTDAIREGLGQHKNVDIACLGNFSEHEMRGIAAAGSDTFHVQQHFARRGHPYQIETGSIIDNPVRGIIDPLGILKQLDRLRDPIVKRVSISFRFNYSRGHEREDAAQKVIDIIDRFCKQPAHGSVDRLLFLRDLCAHWVGRQKRDDLLEALVALHEAFTLKQSAVPRFTTHYIGVSMRAVNRPHVILPQRLSPEEEAYFLPQVFNPNLNEARTDYLDWHGGHLRGGLIDEATTHPDPRFPALDSFCNALNTIAPTLASLGDSADAQFFARMAASLRMYACIMRSVNNFFAMGTLRERNKGKLAAAPHIPPKIGDWTGDPDLQLMNATMRDELDNTTDLIHLLQTHGTDHLLLADAPGDEDTFLLGPNLLDTLRQKSRIMTRHWTGAESQMTTPHK